jgi:hypothetical protein
MTAPKREVRWNRLTAARRTVGRSCESETEQTRKTYAGERMEERRKRIGGNNERTRITDPSGTDTKRTACVGGGRACWSCVSGCRCATERTQCDMLHDSGYAVESAAECASCDAHHGKPSREIETRNASPQPQTQGRSPGMQSIKKYLSLEIPLPPHPSSEGDGRRRTKRGSRLQEVSEPRGVLSVGGLERRDGVCVG